MKVAIVQETLDPALGGAESATAEMAAALAALGLDVTVLSAGPRRSAPASAPACPSFAHVTFAARGATRAARTRAFVEWAETRCAAGGFDVVHAVTPCRAAQVYQPRGGTFVETVARSVARGRTPLGRWLRRLGKRWNARQRFLARVERELLVRRDPPVVAALSDYVRRQIVGGFPEFPAARVRVVFNGVGIAPLDARRAGEARRHVRVRFGLSDAAPLALFAAHNFKLKGLGELLRALAEPAARGVALLVAGRDDPRRHAGRARRLGIAGRVRFAGSVADARTLYAAADVLVHPTWYDPCSRVVLEALCCGVPVVTTRWNGAAEVVEAGRYGEVVESPDDSAALAGAIARCLGPTYRAALADEAARVRERLSMARHARELVDLYRGSAAPRGAARSFQLL